MATIIIFVVFGLLVVIGNIILQKGRQNYYHRPYPSSPASPSESKEVRENKPSVNIPRSLFDLPDGFVCTPEFERAFDRMEHTDKCLFITGKAGTGKSTLITYFRINTKKSVVYLAPTGVAALNIGGQTIHSFFQFPPEIKFLLRRTLSPRQASGYYGRACTAPSGPAAKIGRLLVAANTLSSSLFTAVASYGVLNRIGFAK